MVRLSVSPSSPHASILHSILLGYMTYARQLVAAVTALGSSSTLLDVQDTELTTGGLDDPGPVGGGVVAGGEECLSVFANPTNIK